jgi:CO/xanthine dehydrogenase FAD-binding subunit
LIAINDLDELSRIRVDGDELAIGAMVRHAGLVTQGRDGHRTIPIRGVLRGAVRDRAARG